MTDVSTSLDTYLKKNYKLDLSKLPPVEYVNDKVTGFKMGQIAQFARPWCSTSVSALFMPERYVCHSRTRGIPIDDQGYVYTSWNLFEAGMEVSPESPVDFSDTTRKLVILQRYYKDDNGEHLEDGRVVMDLDIFRKCFKKVR